MATTTDHPISDTWIGYTVRGVASLKRVRLDDLAHHLHINPSTLSNKLSGKRPWTAVEVALAADALGVSVEQLYNGFDGAVPAPDDADFPTARGDSAGPRRSKPGRTAGTVKNWKLMNPRTGEPITARPAHRAPRVHHSTCSILTGTQGESWTRHAPTWTSSRCDAVHGPRSTHAGGSTAASNPIPVQQ